MHTKIKLILLHHLPPLPYTCYEHSFFVEITFDAVHILTSETLSLFYCHSQVQLQTSGNLKGIIWQLHSVKRVASARMLVILPSEVCWIIKVSLTCVKLSFSSDLWQAALSPLFFYLISPFFFTASSHSLISLYPSISPLLILLHFSTPDLNLIICFNRLIAFSLCQWWEWNMEKPYKL